MALKYALLASQWPYGHFLKLTNSIFFLNNVTNLRHLTQLIMSCCAHKMAIVLWPQTLSLHPAYTVSGHWLPQVVKFWRCIALLLWCRIIVLCIARQDSNRFIQRNNWPFRVRDGCDMDLWLAWNDRNNHVQSIMIACLQQITSEMLHVRWLWTVAYSSCVKYQCVKKSAGHTL